MRTLRLILGDQLSHSISSLRDLDLQNDRVLMVEVADEATYVPHHKLKIAFLFSAMRHFAKELESKKVRISYITLDDPRSCGSFEETLAGVVKKERFDRLVVTFPGEWRVLQSMRQWESKLGLPVEIRPDDRFYCSPDQFAEWARDKKQLRMEMFYRVMRKESELLMEGPQPVEGVWNLDKENRKALPKEIELPNPPNFTTDKITKDVIQLVEERFPNHFGSLERFEFAVTRRQALLALRHFIEHALPQFGPYQDAMKAGEELLFHSNLSPYLNCGLLLPQEVCEAAERCYYDKSAPLQSVEGFIRQVLGWREFIRGIYWLLMPDYAKRNGLGADRRLPSFYWTADTKMNCMRHVLEQTRDTATSHHIQRLMVTGNFALLAGLNPEEVCAWYLAVYVDAYEWAELPNTLGMALHGDHGVVGSKPYAASGAYINRMSDFCKTCEYKVKERDGEEACPFNFLYWNFLLRHESQLRSNPRMSLIYKNVDRMDQSEKEKIRSRAKDFLDEL